MPYTSAEQRISGSIAAGTPIASSSSGAQSRVVRSISMVRLALVTSVTCSPVNFQISQLSMVPKSTSPRSARSRRPSTSSSSQRSFGPAK